MGEWAMVLFSKETSESMIVAQLCDAMNGVGVENKRFNASMIRGLEIKRKAVKRGLTAFLMVFFFILLSFLCGNNFF